MVRISHSYLLSLDMLISEEVKEESSLGSQARKGYQGIWTK
jgi:hypothetical protein